MNYLEKLLQGAPVEWKTLGEVCDFQNGFAFKSSLFKETGLPIIRITNVNGKTVDLSDLKYFDPNDYQKGNPLNYSIHKGDILVAMSGATTGKLGYYNHEKPAYLNQRVGKFIPNSSKLNNKYLYHFLLSKTEFLYTLAGGGAQPNLSSTDIKEKIKIPIPPLPVQKEIARILDAFIAITSELTSELTLRQKQYQHYRDKLLTFGDEVEWKTLEEVLKRAKGTKITAGQMKELHQENAPIKIFAGGKTFALVNYGDIPDKDIHTKPSIIVKSRGIIEFEYYDKPFSHKNEMWSYYSEDENICLKYVFYFLKSKETHFQQIGSKMQMPQIATPDTDKFKIPLPPIEEQKRIAGILDKFHTLAHSLSEGLPKEIALRQKQYEYYRELLLNFKQDEARFCMA
ncbi:restriction endonuclease subunit S [Avibacterium avium]|uniref:restriction endonuclease subunit S n=1 Tax=Avibacterium avium TaxID=751 RepID=UPI003BF8AE18